MSSRPLGHSFRPLSTPRIARLALSLLFLVALVLVPGVGDAHALSRAARPDTLPPGFDTTRQVVPAQSCGVRIIDVTVSVYREVPAGPLRELYNDNIRYFADGVYEMSNCAHKIGRVTVY